MLKKASLLTHPTLATISPSRPESAKTASSPWDAPYPKQGRSSASDPRFTFHASRFLGADARTPLGMGASRRAGVGRVKRATFSASCYLLSVGEQGNPADHRPVHPAFPPIGIKELIMTNRAQIHRRNKRGRHARSFHLQTDQGFEIQPSLMPVIIMHNRFPIWQSYSELIEHGSVHLIAAGTGRGP